MVGEEATSCFNELCKTRHSPSRIRLHTMMNDSDYILWTFDIMGLALWTYGSTIAVREPPLILSTQLPLGVAIFSNGPRNGSKNQPQSGVQVNLMTLTSHCLITTPLGVHRTSACCAGEGFKKIYKIFKRTFAHAALDEIQELTSTLWNQSSPK